MKQNANIPLLSNVCQNQIVDIHLNLKSEEYDLISNQLLQMQPKPQPAITCPYSKWHLFESTCVYLRPQSDFSFCSLTYSQQHTLKSLLVPSKPSIKITGSQNPSVVIQIIGLESMSYEEFKSLVNCQKFAYYQKSWYIPYTQKLYEFLLELYPPGLSVEIEKTNGNSILNKLFSKCDDILQQQQTICKSQDEYVTVNQYVNSLDDIKNAVSYFRISHKIQIMISDTTLTAEFKKPANYLYNRDGKLIQNITIIHGTRFEICFVAYRSEVLEHAHLLNQQNAVFSIFQQPLSQQQIEIMNQQYMQQMQMVQMQKTLEQQELAQKRLLEAQIVAPKPQQPVKAQQVVPQAEKEAKTVKTATIQQDKTAQKPIQKEPKEPKQQNEVKKEPPKPLEIHKKLSELKQKLKNGEKIIIAKNPKTEMQFKFGILGAQIVAQYNDKDWEGIEHIVL
ncbi:Conserved_hypothetical protein [Hexamita inflata]|uniref:Uncharacterized protein n=1 Tax=Hexamita inflata TaxID=28002 RepID=A0AA86TM52_9EUKA|nr:Conserved hypothetical protein [Hexamita inflata]